MRYIIVLAAAILIVVTTWPYLRHYMPRRQTPQRGMPKPPSKGELIYFAFLVTIALSFGISTMLWIFGK